MANGAIARYNQWVAITPSDTVLIDPSKTSIGESVALTDAIFVGGAGIVAAVAENGTVVNFTCVAGAVLPIAVQRINATNTTATLLVALYQR